MTVCEPGSISMAVYRQLRHRTAISATQRLPLSSSASVKSMCLFIHPNNKLPGTTVARRWRHDNKTHGLTYLLQLLSWENLTALVSGSLWLWETTACVRNSSRSHTGQLVRRDILGSNSGKGDFSQMSVFRAYPLRHLGL